LGGLFRPDYESALGGMTKRVRVTSPIVKEQRWHHDHTSRSKKSLVYDEEPP